MLNKKIALDKRLIRQCQNGNYWVMMPIGRMVDRKEMKQRWINSQFRGYGFFCGKSEIKNLNANKFELDVDTDRIFALQNDGLQLKLNVDELSQAFNFVALDKKSERINPPKNISSMLVDIGNKIPEELKNKPRWAAFKAEYEKDSLEKDGELMAKKKKKPYDTNTFEGTYARCNDNKTMATFEHALKFAVDNHYDGLAYALDGEESCIDLDKCFTADGKMTTLADKLTDYCGKTYIEKSCSGNGVHIFIKGDLLDKGKYNYRKDTVYGEIEAYSGSDTGRFICISGNSLNNVKEIGSLNDKRMSEIRRVLGEQCPTATVQQEINATPANNGTAQKITPSTTQKSNNNNKILNSKNMSTSEIVDWILSGVKRAEFKDLLNGGGTFKKSDGSLDRSRNDLKFCQIVAWYTDGNERQIRDVFESSARYNAALQHDKSATYLERTINQAVTFTRRIGTISDMIAKNECTK